MTLSRRSFLKSSLVLSTAPLILPPHVLGRGGATAPNSKLVMGTIGCGNQGRGDTSHFFNMSNIVFTAFCDPDTERREAFKVKYGAKSGAQTYNDFRELLGHPDLDAVVIATPDHWHASPAIAAARAGLDIYCEKPLSLTIREARAMVNAVRQNERVFQTGSQQRSHGEFRHACEIIRNGLIGKVREVFVRVGGPSRECDLPPEPVPAGVDWNLWLGPAPWRPFNSHIHPGWRSWRDYAGGGTTDWGAHHFDIVQWAFGMDESGPVEILPPDDKDRPCLAVRYANGALVYHATGDDAKKLHWPDEPEGDGNGITFVGENGWVEVDRSHIRTFPENLVRWHPGPNDIQLQSNSGHHRNFIDCIRTRRRPICDVEIGCRSVTVCHLVNIGHWLQQPFHWDPIKEQIPDNPAAALWLDRAKRAPWTI
jgi:predicted dehydrogenase